MSTAAVESSVQRPLSSRSSALVLLQLAILVVTVWTYQLDPFHRLPAALTIAAAGFLIHDRLVPRYQLPFFLAISAASFATSLGFQNAAWLGVIGAPLIVIAVSRLRWWQRSALLVGATGGIIGMRARIESPIWIVLGSIFMFRMFSYLHCVRREGTRASRWMTWSYFFMAPNAFYGLFPVVDYTTFCECRYNSDRRQIYQSGIHYLCVGILQLILYRLIKYEILPPPLEVRTVRSLMLFLAANYGLYVYVSGTFHIICGMLHLYGFNLPRTHDHYFLAASFTDIWRRINTYWKDFMQKVVFLPAVYHLRSKGLPMAVVAGVLWTFFWTWLAHAWQQFWLVGHFPLKLQEAGLWMSAGTVVAVNALLEMRSRQRAVPDSAEFQWRRSLTHWLKVIGVFVTVSLFWASWTHPEIIQLLSVSLRDQWSGRASGTWITASVLDAIVLGAVTAGLVGVGMTWDLLKRRLPGESLPSLTRQTVTRDADADFESSVMAHLIPLAILLLLAQSPVQALVGRRLSGVLAGLTSEHLTRGESIGAIRGYYEQLSAGSVLAGPMAPYAPGSRNESVAVFTAMTRPRRDLLKAELIPGWEGNYGGGHITINRWGMRDRDRELVKPPGTFRIAMVGSSVVMGAGVDDVQVSSRLLEEHLNDAPSDWGAAVEVLNFGMGQFSPIQRRAQIAHQVIPFAPDLVIYVGHQDEPDGSTTTLANAISHFVPLEDPCLEEVVQNMRIPANASEIMYFAKAGEARDEVLACTYATIHESCRSAYAAVLYVYLPIPGDHEITLDPRVAIDVARKAGMETVDLTGWWKDHSPAEVLVSQEDNHPNPLGQRLIAEALEDVLRKWRQRQSAASNATP